VHLILAGTRQQRRRAGRAGGGGRDIGDHRVHSFGVGPRRLRAGLRPAQLRGGHRLHGARDLLRVFHAGDAAADLGKGGHGFG